MQTPDDNVKRLIEETKRIEEEEGEVVPAEDAEEGEKNEELDQEGLDRLARVLDRVAVLSEEADRSMPKVVERTEDSVVGELLVVLAFASS